MGRVGRGIWLGRLVCFRASFALFVGFFGGGRGGSLDGMSCFGAESWVENVDLLGLTLHTDTPFSRVRRCPLSAALTHGPFDSHYTHISSDRVYR